MYFFANPYKVLSIVVMVNIIPIKLPFLSQKLLSFADSLKFGTMSEVLTGERKNITIATTYNTTIPVNIFIGIVIIVFFQLLRIVPIKAIPITKETKRNSSIIRVCC